MNYNRRQFLGQSAATATASVAAATTFLPAPVQGQSAVNSDIAIIDCHQHLWDLDKFTLPWIKPGSLLGRSYVMSDYLAAIEGTGIRNSIYMEVDVEPSQQQAESDHLRQRLPTGDHHQKGKHDAGHRDAERRSRDGARELRDRQRAGCSKNRSLGVSRVDNRRNSVEHLTELFVFLLYAVNCLPSIGHVTCNES
jgi:predicted TIM-barrel fold metal-dependent hydrolase